MVTPRTSGMSAMGKSETTQSDRIRTNGNTPGQLEVTIAPIRYVSFFIALSIFVIFWSIGVLAALSWIPALIIFFLLCQQSQLPHEHCTQVLSKLASDWPMLLLTFGIWVPVWCLVGTVIVRVWLYYIWGRERVVATPHCLSIELVIPWFHQVRRFNIMELSNLRFSPEPLPVQSRNLYGSWKFLETMLGFDRGSIAVEYLKETYRFGIALSEAEALSVVSTIDEFLEKVDEKSRYSKQ